MVPSVRQPMLTIINLTSQPQELGTITLSTLPANYDLYLYNSNQTQVGASKKTGTTSETISKTFSKTGVFYVKVVGVSGAFNASSCYNIERNLGNCIRKCRR